MHLLKDAFERFAPVYLEQFEDRMLSSHKDALKDIQNCQSDELGGSLYICEDCGHEKYVFHSCRNRSCFKCHEQRTEKWLDKQYSQIIPVPHFHFVFTLPAELRLIVRSNQKALYKILMNSAFEALQKLADDPKHIGGRIGAIAVLHTWSRTMEYHPHVHMMIPAGAVTKDKKWLSIKNDYFIPVQALKKIFRATFMKKARRSLPDQIFPGKVWHKDWNIFCKRFDSKLEKLLDYLGRYVYRIAISNNRIVAVDSTSVSIKNDKQSDKPIRLGGKEFIRRYLMHVLPKGFHKVRHFGIMHGSQKKLRAQIKVTLLNKLLSLPERPIKAKVQLKCTKCHSLKIKSMRLIAGMYKSSPVVNCKPP